MECSYSADREIVTVEEGKFSINNLSSYFGNLEKVVQGKPKSKQKKGNNIDKSRN